MPCVWANIRMQSDFKDISLIDSIIPEFDKALRAVFAAAPTRRPMPGQDLPEAAMSEDEKRHVAALMRVNHCGEICAQALYQGQALISHDPAVRRELDQAAWEETEHLNWTERRIAELGGRKSVLNPLWYAGSVAIGLAAGLAGRRWSLGFVTETERQVEAHLTDHLGRLPEDDLRSRAIVERMRSDEVRHGSAARDAGGADLPTPVRGLMRLASRVMTRTAYRF